MTALELWCFSCIIFTFGSLLSYVIILLKMQQNNSVDPKSADKFGCAKDEKVLFSCNLCSFAIFNICFWYIFLFN